MPKRDNKRIKLGRIFELYIKGERAAASELLYMEHYNKIYGIAFSILKDESESADAVHNVIIKLHNLEKEKFPAAGSELSWLYSVTLNEARQLKRREKPRIFEYKITDELPSYDVDIKQFVDMEAYYSMLKGLSEEEIKVVTLKVISKYTNKEVAEILGMNVGRVKWLYSKSMKKLRKSLAFMIPAFILSLSQAIYHFAKYIRRVDSFINTSGGNVANVPFDHRVTFYGAICLVCIILSIKACAKNRKIKK